MAGLWEFPWEEGHLSKEETGKTLGEWGIVPKKRHTLRPAKHIFTHMEWRMAGVLAVCEKILPPEGLRLVTWEEMETVYTVPSAFSAFQKAALAAREEFA